MDEQPTPLWLSHHQPDQLDRCVVVGRWHVCRRCVVLYPLAAAVTALAAVLGSSGDAAAVALVVLPLPAAIEFCLEQLGRLRYSPRRQVALTVPLAIGLGCGFARYLDDPTDLLFWGVVAVYGAACIGTVLWRILDESAS